MSAGGLTLRAFSKEVSSASYKDNNEASLLGGENKDSRGRPAGALALNACTHPVMRGGGPGGGLLAIRYFTETGKNGKMTLYKEAWDAYRGERLSIRLPVIEDIEGFEVSFLSGNGWAKAWDTSERRSLRDKGGRMIKRTARSQYRAIPGL